MMEMFVKNNVGGAQAAAQATAQPQPRTIPTCFKCGVKGHFSNQCKKNVADEKKAKPTDNKRPIKCYASGGFGHMVWRCPDNKTKNNEKAKKKLPAESVRGIKGEDNRSMKDHPVYIRARIERKDAVCLVDTGSEKCVITRKLVDEAAME